MLIYFNVASTLLLPSLFFVLMLIRSVKYISIIYILLSWKLVVESSFIRGVKDLLVFTKPPTVNQYVPVSSEAKLYLGCCALQILRNFNNIYSHVYISKIEMWIQRNNLFALLLTYPIPIALVSVLKNDLKEKTTRQLHFIRGPNNAPMSQRWTM